MESDKNSDHKIAKNGNAPLYRQLEEILKQRIKNGELKPGDQIPTEFDLCEQFGISRISVRQALAELANDGFLCRHQGRGTFVNHLVASKVTLVRALIAEEQWIPPLREAVLLYNEEGHDRTIHLDIQAVGRPQLRSEILSAVGRGEAPDFALIDWAWRVEFSNLHFLKRLDRLDPKWAEEFKADLFPAFVDTTTPTLYGIQPEANVSVVWYRKDWFAKERINPPRRWNELVEVSKHFQKREKYPLAFVGGTQAGETTTYQLLPFIWAGGGNLFTNENVGLDDRVVNAVRFLVDLVHKYKVVSPDVVSYSWDQPARLFAQGHLALAVGGSYEKAVIQDVSGWDDEAFRAKVGCIPIPAGPDGAMATVAGGMTYVIFRQARDAKLALEILKRVASPGLMHKFCAETGRSPTRTSVVRALDSERDWFSHHVASFLNSARARSGITEYAKVSEQFQVMMENALSGRMNPRQAVEKASEIMKILISENRNEDVASL
ncbi:extracellular solute-binding protein [Candidatus Bipolaricaulota bacterium]|nr:extracellular solute-binding protein [Candidatus Bipolaricaulota bacterium]